VLSLPTQLAPDLPFDIIGRPAGEQGSSGDEKYIPITAHYFAALRIPLIAGRTFTVGDVHGSAPVVIVNQQLARIYFKGENPVGQRIRIGAAMGPGFEDSVREVVGVVGDTKQVGLDAPAPGIMYLPADQIPDALTQMDARLLGMSWVVRSKSARVNVATTVRQIFMDYVRTPLLSVKTMQDVMRASVAQQRFNMLLLSAFGLIAVVLGAAGLYGVMSYSVARQTKEIGVRMALGAQRGHILGMVLREASLLVGAGLVIGVAASVAGARLLRSLLFGVAPRDPITLVSVCGVLLLTGLLAAWWPAKRAASTEPMQALRME
jgi:predicted permease